LGQQQNIGAILRTILGQQQNTGAILRTILGQHQNSWLYASNEGVIKLPQQVDPH